MAGNTFGTIFRLTTFGESHGPAIGGVVDGCPAGLAFDLSAVQHELDRRRPGQSELVSPRNEPDRVEILSGVFEGITTGTPIAFLIRNQDSNPSDYQAMKEVFRPSHADLSYFLKYGVRDHRGGGRSSARETAARVAGGAIARLLLSASGINIVACTSRIGKIGINTETIVLSPDQIEANPLRCPDSQAAKEMERYLDMIRKSGDTVGSEVFCMISNLPAGLGEPVFDKFNADLAKAMISINGANGFEIGSGFRAGNMKGSEHNDQLMPGTHGPEFLTNRSGGVQGGITNGQPVYFRISFKPVPTIGLSQPTIDSKGEAVTLSGKGRHDSCIAPRAVPVVEAMACLVTADHLLRNKTARGN